MLRTVAEVVGVTAEDVAALPPGAIDDLVERIVMKDPSVVRTRD